MPTDTVAVTVTSGTTSTPKAVELTDAGRRAHIQGYATLLDASPDDRWLCCLPLHHVSGLSTIARSRDAGSPPVVHPTFDVTAVGNAPRTSGVTMVSVVPTMLTRLLDAGAPMHEYHCVVVGGAPVSAALQARVDAAGINLFNTYGMTETWGGITMNGRPLPEVTIRLTGEGADEIEIRGPQLMRGYRSRPADTAAVFTDDGYLRTGDIGEWDDDGRLCIVDRARDLIITGGVNVSPTAVEAVLAEHPDVADLCVRGTPDPGWGERVVAFAVARNPDRPPTIESLRAFGRERLNAVQLPKQLILLDTIPRSPGGKALRRELHVPE